MILFFIIQQEFCISRL